MIGTDLPFARVILEDFEFIATPGERPDVVCGVFHDLNTGQPIRLWRDQLGDQPPYDIGPDTLVVCFVANAEMACHLALNWPIPKNILDLSPEFKCQVNGKGISRKNQGLIGALQYFGLSSIAPKRKDAMRDRIIKGRPFTDQEREQILAYCAEDVEALRRLLVKLLPNIELPIALHRGEAVAALARSEHVGVPIDMDVFSQLADKKTWRDIRDSMVPLVDVHGIYIRDKNGWHWNNARFEEWTVSERINWPRKEESGKLNLQRKTFESMAKAYPQVEPLRQLRYIRDKLRTIKLSVGRDGRNRTVLWPFSSKTSRTQPKAKHWIFSPSVWLRFLIRPEAGKALAYIDYSSMERCGPSNAMLELYRSGDPYLNFGKIIGYIPPDATRQTPGIEAIRDRLKVLCLAVQYGMQTSTLASRLGVSEIEAHEMLLHHRGLFSQYWHWSEDWLHHSLDIGAMRTVFGWECATGIVEFNERSIRNFPVQANCADLFRLAYVWGTRHGLTLIAPVHDAVLLESSDDQIEADVALMREIMRRASRVILNRGRHDRAAHRREDHPASRPLHRQPRHRAVGNRAEAFGRAPTTAAGRHCHEGGRVMDNEPWHIKRRRELEAAAPVKRKKVEPFVKVPLWWIEPAAKASASPATILLVELLHLRWKTRRSTFPLPNGRLKRLGVSREVKRRVLRDLEGAKLISVERPLRKTPVVTLIGFLGVRERHILAVYEQNMICLLAPHTIPVLSSLSLTFYVFIFNREEEENVIPLTSSPIPEPRYDGGRSSR